MSDEPDLHDVESMIEAAFRGQVAALYHARAASMGPVEARESVKRWVVRFGARLSGVAHRTLDAEVRR